MEKYNKLLRDITQLIEKGLFTSKDLYGEFIIIGPKLIIPKHFACNSRNIFWKLYQHFDRSHS